MVARYRQAASGARDARRRGKPPAPLIAWGLGVPVVAPVGIGHNNGPVIDDEAPGYLWRRYRWAKVHAAARKAPSMGVLRFRVARAEAAGLDYQTYLSGLLDTGRFAQVRDADTARLAALAAVRTAWRVVLGRLAPDTPRMASAIVLASLTGAYDEARRTYHNAAHIAAVLASIETHGVADASDADAVRMAALFHDVVYDARRNDNEVESARVAALQLSELGCNRQRIARIVVMIEATRHRPEDVASADADTALLLDCDLAVLAAAPDAYRVYASAVRNEYAHVPDEAFRAGRARVLRMFLARPRLYATARLSAIWEAVARDNLAAECAELETG